MRIHQPAEGAAAVRQLLTDFEPETINLLLEKPEKLVLALKARVPKERDREQNEPDSQQAADAATAETEAEMELLEMLKPYGLEGWRKFAAALETISPEFAGSLP